MEEYFPSFSTTNMHIVDYPSQLHLHTTQSSPSPSRVQSTNPLPIHISTRYISPHGHIFSFRKRRPDLRNSISGEATHSGELQIKDIEEEYVVCLVPKDLRVKGLTRIYAAHPVKPNPHPPFPVYSRPVSLKKQPKTAGNRYIFARDPPTEAPVLSNFPVLMQRPMLSTPLMPLQLRSGKVKPAVEAQRKRPSRSIGSSPYDRKQGKRNGKVKMEGGGISERNREEV